MTDEQRWPDPVYLTKDHAVNITLRDYFASKAMQGILASSNTPKSATNEEIAKESYYLADAMLKARKQ